MIALQVKQESPEMIFRDRAPVGEAVAFAQVDDQQVERVAAALAQ